MKRVRSKKGRMRELRITNRYTEWAYYRECPEMTNNYKKIHKMPMRHCY